MELCTRCRVIPMNIMKTMFTIGWHRSDDEVETICYFSDVVGRLIRTNRSWNAFVWLFSRHRQTRRTFLIWKLFIRQSLSPETHRRQHLAVFLFALRHNSTINALAGICPIDELPRYSNWTTKTNSAALNVHWHARSHRNGSARAKQAFNVNVTLFVCMCRKVFQIKRRYRRNRAMIHDD